MEEKTVSLSPLPELTMGQAVKNVWNRYATFRGRARRSEYWWWTLAVILGEIVSAVIDVSTGLNYPGLPYGAVYSLFALAVFIPGLAVLFRRLHDTGRSGWNILWVLIPLVGSIVLIVFCCFDSDPYTNAYGASPKYPEAETPVEA